MDSRSSPHPAGAPICYTINNPPLRLAAGGEARPGGVWSGVGGGGWKQ
jgi:hypothetical protein